MDEIQEFLTWDLERFEKLLIEFWKDFKVSAVIAGVQTVNTEADTPKKLPSLASLNGENLQESRPSASC